LRHGLGRVFLPLGLGPLSGLVRNATYRPISANRFGDTLGADLARSRMARTQSVSFGSLLTS
jgi:hypothetical protein